MIEFDVDDLVRTVQNVVSYGTGFVGEVESRRLWFNTELGNLIKQMLGEYIDAQARLDPSRLHHVYEWGQAGNESARLFEFSMTATTEIITLRGSFLPSTSGEQPFHDKAQVMESGASVTIQPKHSEVLVFEDDGETIFVTGSIYVEHPGGPDVAGSFADTIEDFIDGYLNVAFIKPILNKMSEMTEFSRYFSAGAKGGSSVGKRAARQYMSLKEGM